MKLLERPTRLSLAVLSLFVCWALALPAPALAQDPDDFSYVSLNNAGVVAVLHNTSVLTTITLGGRPSGIAVAPDGSRVYIANAGTGTVSIVDPALIVPSIGDPAINPVIGSVTVGFNPEDLAFTPDGARVFVANVGANVRFSAIDTSLAETNPAAAVTAINNNTISGTRFGIATADVGGTTLVFAGFSGGTVVVIDPVSFAYLASFASGGSITQDVAASVDGTRVYVANGSGSVAVIDTALVLDRIADGSTNPVIGQVTVPDQPLGLAVSNDGATVYVTRAGTDRVGIIDTTKVGTAEDPLVGEIVAGDSPFGVAFSPDGTQAVIANRIGNSATFVLGPAPLTISFGSLGLGQTGPRWVGALPGQPPPDTPPAFSLPSCGDSIAATLNQELVVAVSVTDDHGALVTMTASPAGGALDAPFPTELGSPVSGTFRWTPTASDPAGDYELTFVADDTVNTAVSCSVTIAVPEPPVNTPAGSTVTVTPVDETTSTTPVTLTFATVTVGGDTTLATTPTGPELPAGFLLGAPPVYYDISTSAQYSGEIGVCIDYSGLSFSDESTLTLQHFDGSAWHDTTTALDTAGDTICGSTTSLSYFTVAEAEPAPDAVEFAAFHLNLAMISTRGRFADRIWFNGNFNVDLEHGDDIAPGEEDVTINIEGVEWTIPAGDFHSKLRGRLFFYRGTINGTKLLVHITPRGRRGSGRYSINVSGWNADMDGAERPLNMCLTVGDDSGCAEKRGLIR